MSTNTGTAECATRRPRLLPARVELHYNSLAPFGWNDGAVWLGRGLTAVVGGGATVTLGPLTATLAPIAFVAQNQSFPLKPTGFSGALAFADPQSLQYIDLPQRFGEGAYGRVDPGQSEVRLEAYGLTAGVSTSNESWGPADSYQILLGNNAAGIPRLFFGTSSATRIGPLGRIHGRLIYGRLAESEFSVMRDSGRVRLASAAVAVFQPAILPGLEIGAARFFHVLQDRFSLDATEVTRPFGVLFKNQRSGVEEPENQLASVWARIVFPRDGLEIYGEFGREDHNWDIKEFWQFLDHDSAYLIGLGKAWRTGDGLLGLRAEVLNSRITHLALSSNQLPLYIHGPVRQGHTHHGQPLGAVGGYSGGGMIVRLERTERRATNAITWQRVQLADRRIPKKPPVLNVADVAHILRVDQRRLVQNLELDAGLGIVYEINKSEVGRDAFGLMARIAFTGLIGRE